jgi:polysaccharide biosynthesis transport protein
MGATLARDGDRGARDRAPDLLEYWRVIVRGKWIILFTTTLVVGVVLVWSFLQPTAYEGSLRMAVVPRPPEILAGGGADAGDSSKPDITTELIVLDSQELRQMVADRLGHTPDVEFVNTSGNIIEVKARASSGAEAAADADAYVDTYIEQRRDDAIGTLEAQKESVQRQINELQLRLADPSLPPGVVSSTETQIFKLQTEISRIDAALASPNPGARRI